MKKFLFCLTLLLMAVSVFTQVLATEGEAQEAATVTEKVEISFCVGDDTLIINGAPVKVEKPYVLDIGVTLVPVRVITEAFDAKVDWVDETQTVILTYPDVNITIQIGNPIAEVNGRAVEMLAAPELTESGYTMVPLRFISENFGADVGYDEATERITVTKEKVVDEEVSIEGSVTNKYIGDSYYLWSMENPLDMTMEYRDFEGMDTLFSEGDNYINIEIFVYDAEEFDFESDYNKSKTALSNLTLVKNEKDTSDNNCLSYHLAAKDKNDYLDFQQYVTTEYIYTVTGKFSNEDAAARDKYLKLLDTFVCKYEETDIYDLSNIVDGYRKFEAEHLKLSFDVPQNFCLAGSEDSQNSFEFYELNTEEQISGIRMVVYSKSDVTSAKALATKDYEHNKKNMNEDITKFSSSLEQRDYTNISAYEYWLTVDSEARKMHARDVFFELGDYVYNMRVDVELPNDECKVFIDRIIQSIKVEELNSEEVGILMTNEPTATGYITKKIGRASVEIPNNYIEVISNDNTLGYYSTLNGVVFSCIRTQVSDVSTRELKELMEKAQNDMKQDGAIVVRNVYERMIDGQKFVDFIVNDDGNMFEQVACLYNGYAYIFTINCSESMYSKSNRSEIKKIIESVTFER